MLPKYLNPTPDENSSVLIHHETCKYFENHCHFHPDLELNLILKSTGTRFVGDSMQSFKEDDLVLLGANVPHNWKSDQTYFSHGDERNAEAIVVRFPEKFMGKDQFSMPEFQRIQNLFEEAKRGLFITGDGKDRIISSIKKLVNYQGMERLIIFLGVLNAIIKTCDYTYLSSEGFMKSLSPKNEKRMDSVYNFITNNFQKKITLAEIAGKADMNPSAFSRYFSQYTQKSVTGFLQEIRLGYAGKLLVESEQNISEIIFESGFQNQAYFNKLFVERVGMTPNEYRRKHQESSR